MRERKRPGRPANGDGNNKERILDAARNEFSTNGYQGTSLRSIAAHAGVDVALIAHYFGGKESLFIATMELPLDAQKEILNALMAPGTTQAEALTRAYLGLWEDPRTRAQIQVVTRSALGNEAAMQRLRTMMSAAIDGSFREAIAGHQVGFALAMSHLLGVAFTRYLLALPPMVDLDFETLVTRVTPAVRLHLDTRS